MADRPRQRICIVVLGMHRSGTSALTRTLALLGADLPAHVMGPGPGNLAGHWEPDDLVAIHDRMLTEAGSGWSDWRAFDPATLQNDRLRAYRVEIIACLEEEYRNSSLFALKDPRVSRFVSLYADVLGSMGIDARYVLCTRNPQAVIASLTARDSLPAAASALLWLRHVLDSEAATRSSTRCFVSFEALMEDWQRTATIVGDSLGITWPNVLEDAAPAIGEFLAPELMHHRASVDDLIDQRETGGWVTTAYEAMESLTLDQSDPAALAALDQVRAEFDPMAALFGSATFPEMYARDRRINELDDECQRERLRAAQTERQLVATLNSRSWRITQPLRDAKGVLSRHRVTHDA